MRSSTIAALLVAAFATSFPPSSAAKPPLEAFTPLAETHDMTISPDGKRVAWVQKSGDGHGIVERDLETGKSRSITQTTRQDITSLRYLTDRYLMFIPYEVVYVAGESDIFRGGTLMLYDVQRAISYPSDAFGEALRVSEDGKRAYFYGRWTVIEIELSNGQSMKTSFGGMRSEDAFALSQSGVLLATQNIDREKGENTISAVTKGVRKAWFSEKGKPPEVFLEGPTTDGASVILLDRRGGAVLRSLNLADGALSEPLFGGAEVSRALLDETGAVVGGVLAGLYPKYEFFDNALTAESRSLRASFPGQAVHVSGFSAGKKRLLLRVEGGIEPGRHVIFDREARKLISIMPARPSIAKEDMGEVVTIEYPARDGQKIGAVLTWPARVPADQRKMLPMVVLPHDEPDEFDDVGYDWLPQFLANEGYAVLQPNYRGSGGQGAAFRAAGDDQFGRIMQHDVTDGVFELVKAGWIDEDRICIIGQGWGGYIALMGAAVTPNRYRCVVSIGGVTDLPDFLKKRAEGDVRYSDYYAKWVRLLGDADANWTNQQRYSPVNLARQFRAEVLLIHGDNDSFSPDRQSRKMQSALKAINKDARFVLIPRDSQGLLYPQSRHQVQREVSAFLAANLAPRPQPAQGAVTTLPP